MGRTADAASFMLASMVHRLVSRTQSRRRGSRMPGCQLELAESLAAEA